MTSGWRTRRERRLGSGTLSGSSARRGLRGGLCSAGGGGTALVPTVGGGLKGLLPLALAAALPLHDSRQFRKTAPASKVGKDYGESESALY